MPPVNPAVSERRLALGTAASFASRFASIIVNLAVIPILFHKLDRDHLGIWLLCGQATAFLSLLDLGLIPTLTRRIAFVAANPSAENGSLQDLVAMGRWVLSALALGMCVIGLAYGALVFRWTATSTVPQQEALLVWALVCGSYATTIWGGIWSSILQGHGRLGVDVAISLVATVATACLQALAVTLGCGLTVLGLIAMGTALCSRTMARTAALRVMPEAATMRPRWNRDLARTIARPAARLWVTALGSFLIIKTDQFFIAAFMSPADIPPYYVAYQLVSNLYAFAGGFVTSAVSFISAAWSTGDRDRARELVCRNAATAMTLMACGIACVLVAGESIIAVWIGPGTFIGYPVVLVFCVMLTLQLHHKTFEYPVRATGDEAFAGWYLAAGFINLVASWLLVGPLGFLGLALGTAIAQALTTNWFAVARGTRVFAITLGEHARRVVLPAVAAFALAYGSATAATASLAAGQHDIPRLVVAAAVCGTILAVALRLRLPVRQAVTV